MANKQKTDVLGILEAFKEAVSTKDVDAFVALYDKDARIFDMWDKWSYHDTISWRGMVAQWFGSQGTERDAVDFNDVQTIVANDVAIIHAFVTFTGLSAEGKKLRSMDERLTWTLVKKEGGWKIAHQHTSAPVDFQTMKVIVTH
jgi:ketosteroid isomerase-like protein